VKDKFILLSKSYNYGQYDPLYDTSKSYNYGQYDPLYASSKSKLPQNQKYPKPQTLRYGIIVELLKCTGGLDFSTLQISTPNNVTAAAATTPSQTTEKSHAVQFDHAFEWMYNQEESYPDLKLESKDGMIINAHKFVLAARSSQFRSLIEGQTKQNDFRGILKVPDLYAKPLMVILKWIYTGKLVMEGFEQGVLKEVIFNSAKYGLPQLLRLCEDEMIKICNAENMLDLIKIAKFYGMPLATKSISAFIRE